MILHPYRCSTRGAVEPVMPAGRYRGQPMRSVYDAVELDTLLSEPLVYLWTDAERRAMEAQLRRCDLSSLTGGD